MNRLRVTIAGAGGTGVSLAEALAIRGDVDVSLIDVRGDLATGRALDIQHSRPLLRTDFSIAGGADLALMDNTDVVVITAGQGRRPGMAREDLVFVNGAIVDNIAREAKARCPDAFLVILTNPADLMTQVAREASGFAPERVIGQGGILDSARLSANIADALGISVLDVQAMVLGGHGDSMVPVADFAAVHGIPVRHLLDETTWNHIVHRTRYAGSEVLSHFETHGAAFTPGWSLAVMVQALTSPTPRLLPISTFAHGTYGLPDVCLGLPALLSYRGVEQVVEIPLAADEASALSESASTLQRAWAKYKTSLGHPGSP